MLLGIPITVNFLHVWSHKPAHNNGYGPTHKKSMDISHTVLKITKSQNMSVKCVWILAKQVPLLTIPTIAVKQWFKQQQANLKNAIR
jgi:hypothetical protein